MFLPMNPGGYFPMGDQCYFLPYFSGLGYPSTSDLIPEHAKLPNCSSRIESPDNDKHLNFGIDQILGKDFSDTFPSNSPDSKESSDQCAMKLLAIQHSILQEACSVDLKSYIRENFWKLASPACLPFFTRETDLYASYDAGKSLSSNKLQESNSEARPEGSNEAGLKRSPHVILRRAVFSDLQKHGLEERFQIRKYISKLDRKALSEQLSLKDIQVKVWFQNRRMKWRNSKTHLRDAHLTTSDAESSVTTVESSSE